MTHHGIRAFKIKLFLDLSNAGPVAVSPFVVFNKSKDFLLASSQIFHSVHLFR